VSYPATVAVDRYTYWRYALQMEEGFIWFRLCGELDNTGAAKRSRSKLLYGKPAVRHRTTVSHPSPDYEPTFPASTTYRSILTFVVQTRKPCLYC
jgi:hypothetical protein